MRYRPFGNSGMAVSALSLLVREGGLPGRKPDWQDFLTAALQAGINTFELATSDPALLATVGQALSAVERRLVFVTWRLDGAQGQALTAEALSTLVGEVLEHSGLGYLNLILLHEPAEGLSAEAIALLRTLQEARLTRMLGVAGSTSAIEGYMTTGAFQALALPYNLTSGWASRNRLKAAAARDMAVIDCNTFPAALADQPAQPLGKRRLFGPKVHPLKGVGGYRFLHDTPGWTAEEICLAFALTEPAVTTVQVEPDSIERLRRLAAITDRDLPTGVAAQIEMARFSAGAA